MSTTSVVPAVLDSLIAAVEASDYPYAVFEAWPGVAAEPNMLFFDEITWNLYEIPTMKAGRRQRQEEVSIGWQQWTFGGTDDPTDVATVRDDAFGALSHLEDVLAVDPTAGVGFPTVQQVQLSPTAAGPAAFERGWVYRISGSITIAARLK